MFSEEGGKLRDRIIIVSLERERRVNGIFSARELKTIRTLLNKLLTNAKKASEFAPPRVDEDCSVAEGNL